MAMPRFSCLLAASLAAAGIFVPQAGATPAVLGDGNDPAVAVTPDGTAHVVWRNSTGSQLTHCRVPRGASACAASTIIPTNGRMVERPYVAVNGNVVRIVAGLYDLPGPHYAEVDLFASNDGGATFVPGKRISSIEGLRNAVIGPGAVVTLVGGLEPGTTGFAQVADNGSTPESFVTLANDPYVVGAAVASTPSGLPLVVYHDGAAVRQGQFRRFDGDGDVHDAADWTAPVDIGDVDAPEMVSGPSGTFLLARTRDGLAMRRFDGTTFTAPALLPDATAASRPGLAVDPGGTLHAVWAHGDAAGTHLKYATSTDGATWAHTSVVTSKDPVYVPRVASAADHIGLVVWENAGKVLANAVGPIAQQPPGGQQPPVVQPPVAQPPTVGPIYSGPQRTISTKTGRGIARLRIPRRCLGPGQRFRVDFRFSPRRPRRAGDRPKRVEFLLNRRRVKMDRRGPFQALYTVPATAKPGAVLLVRIRAYRSARGRGGELVSIKGKVRRCA